MIIDIQHFEDEYFLLADVLASFIKWLLSTVQFSRVGAEAGTPSIHQQFSQIRGIAPENPLVRLQDHQKTQV